VSKHYYTFMIDPDLARALKALKARDGIAEAEAIRRALREWLERREVLARTTSRRVGARRKA